MKNRSVSPVLVFGLLAAELAVLGAGAAVVATRHTTHPAPALRSGHSVRVTISSGCPSAITGFDGVSNLKGRDLASILVPPNPNGALICRYSPVLGEQGPSILHGVLYRSVLVSSDAAKRLASEADQIPAFAPGRVRSCPVDIARYDVLVFGYPKRADVDVWYSSTGCSQLTNGYTIRGEFSPAFSAFIKDFDRLAPPVLTLRRR